MISSESTRIGDQFNVLATEFAELEAEYNCSLEHSVCEIPPAGPVSLVVQNQVPVVHSLLLLVSS